MSKEDVINLVFVAYVIGQLTGLYLLIFTASPLLGIIVLLVSGVHVLTLSKFYQ